MTYRHPADKLRTISPAKVFARPTADEIWLGPTRESVLSHLFTPVPIRVIVGPRASGRSTLLKHLAHRTAERGITLTAPGPQKDPDAVLQSLLASAELKTTGLSTVELRSLFSVFIQERLGKMQRVVISIDDADTYSESAWQEIEQLVQCDSDQIVPELLMSVENLDAGASPAASFVRSQPAPALGVVSWLEPKEVASYLKWRLERFELENLSTPAATRLISKVTKGSFSAIDHIMQLTLLLLRNEFARQINVNAVCEAIRRQRSRDHDTGALSLCSAKLIVSENGKVVDEVQLKSHALIGRSPLNDLCLESDFVSRHHLLIARDKDSYFLSDLKSVNGVTLNGGFVDSTRIVDGDVLGVGPFSIKLSLDAAVPELLLEDQVAIAAPKLSATGVMPAPESPEPAHLKVIK